MKFININSMLKRFMRELIGIKQTTDSMTFFRYLCAIAISFPQILSRKSLAPADKRMTGRDYSFVVFGKNITIHGEDFGLAREIYCQKCYFSVPGFRITPNDYVVDMGANVGIFTVLAAKHARKVLSIEAQYEFIRKMEANLKNNKCFEKVCSELGLIGAKSGVFADDTKLRSSPYCSIPPPPISFPNIIERYHIDKIDFLKIDIEGSEFDLFVNDVSWLSKVQKIAMEVHLDFGELKNIITVLEHFGFKIWLVDKNQNIVEVLREPIGYLFVKRE